MKSLIVNFKENKKQFAVCFFVICVCLLADQISKQFMLNLLIKNPYNGISILPFFNLVLVINTGVSFGMFANLFFGKYILTALVCVITFVLIILFLKEKKSLQRYAYALLISGAIGNTIDRIIYGGVIDFLDFHINGNHWPAFNIADSIIFVGTFLLIFGDVINKKFLKTNEKY